MLAGLQPGGEARFRGSQVHTSDTDLGESKLLGPAAQLPQQPRPV
jgi:hypothetical protein